MFNTTSTVSDMLAVERPLPGKGVFAFYTKIVHGWSKLALI